MNLQKSRVFFGLTVAGFLLLCNIGYLFAYSQGRQQLFASQIDQPPIQLLSLLLLGGILAFGFVPANDQGEHP